MKKNVRGESRIELGDREGDCEMQGERDRQNHVDFSSRLNSCGVVVTICACLSVSVALALTAARIVKNDRYTTTSCTPPPQWT
jgi:hypothetical protein